MTRVMGRSRSVTAFLTLVAILWGIAGSCTPCPTAETLVDVGLGQWAIGQSTRPEMTGGTVQMDEDTMVITFTDDDGSSWRVTYRVTGVSR